MTTMSELQEISDAILAGYDFDQYKGITNKRTGEVIGNQCTWCGNHAPIGVPIAHADPCEPLTMDKIQFIRFLIQKDREASMGIEVDGQTYKVSAFYEIGGMDMFRGASRARGFWLMCRPLEFSDGFTTVSLFDAGLRQFEEEVSRYNAKKFDKFVDRHFLWNAGEERTEFSETLLTLINQVVNRHKAGITG